MIHRHQAVTFSEPLKTAKQAELSGKHILLAEDNDINRENCRRITPDAENQDLTLSKMECGMEVQIFTVG